MKVFGLVFIDGALNSAKASIVIIEQGGGNLEASDRAVVQAQEPA